MQNTSRVLINQQSSQQTPLIYAIVGPTASGKTEFAISLANRLQCDILCVDAFQVYRGMDIGTAKPSYQERSLVCHHGLDLVSPLEPFSASRFAIYAESILEQTITKENPIVLCGGTGLYYRSLLEGFFTVPDPDPEIRQSLLDRANINLDEIYQELKKKDPITAEQIHPNDVRRITRALEILYQTGKSISELKKTQGKKPWIDYCQFLGIQWDRDILHQRIEQRTQWMYSSGIIDETIRLIEIGCHPHHTSMQALGYKECYSYCMGKISLLGAIELTTRETRRYARRQITWFRHQFPTHWLQINLNNDFGKIVEQSLHLWVKGGYNIQLET